MKMPQLRELHLVAIDLSMGRWHGMIELLRYATHLECSTVWTLLHDGKQPFPDGRYDHRIPRYVLGRLEDLSLRQPSLRLRAQGQESWDLLPELLGDNERTGLGSSAAMIVRTTMEYIASLQRESIVTLGQQAESELWQESDVAMFT